MYSEFDRYLEEKLKDDEFREEYEKLEPFKAIIDARVKSGMTQKELSEKTGITQGDISKLENGNANPSIRTLQRLASAMGMKLKIEFVSK